MAAGDESIAALIDGAASRLAEAGIEAPRREARLLAAHALGLDAGSPRWADRARRLTHDQAKAFDAAVEQRSTRVPMAHITGVQGFWTLDLAVSSATLIPRADSEALIETLLRLLPDRARGLRVLDLGTGTGCLLLACLSEYPAAWGLGVERSQRACALAASNARANRLAGRCAFLCGYWSEALDVAKANFDVILCNPPYIPTAAIGGLMAEVARWEPASALDGGEDGLDAYRRILAQIPALLAPDGLAVLEMGAGQRGAVQAIAGVFGLGLVAVGLDLGGVERAIALQRGPPAELIGQNA